MSIQKAVAAVAAMAAMAAVATVAAVAAMIAVAAMAIITKHVFFIQIRLVLAVKSTKFYFYQPVS